MPCPSHIHKPTFVFNNGSRVIKYEVLLSGPFNELYIIILSHSLLNTHCIISHSLCNYDVFYENLFLDRNKDWKVFSYSTKTRLLYVRFLPDLLSCCSPFPFSLVPDFSVSFMQRSKVD
jgi:hypothetical protein